MIFVLIIIFYRALHTYLTFVLATSLMAVIVVMSAAPLFPTKFPKGVVRLMNKIETTWYFRNLLAAIAVTILGAADLIDVVSLAVKGSKYYRRIVN